jgi:hypothetical protein
MHFSGAIAGEKEDFCKGSLSVPIFYFIIVFLYFIFACIILSIPNNKVHKGSIVWFFRRTFCKKILPNSVNQPAVSLQIKLKNNFWGNQPTITLRSVVATFAV